MNRPIVAIALICLLAAPAASPARADPPSLEEALRGMAGQLVRDLPDGDSPVTVGVLKWIIQKGGKNSISYGPLNQGLANRLETALLQAQKDSPDMKVKVVRKASAVAAAMPEMTHLSADGRARFFTDAGRAVKYPLYLGGEATPDVMLTGLAKFADDFKTLRIKVYQFTRSDPGSLVKAHDWVEVKVSLELLADSGASFSLRGSFGSDGRPNYVDSEPSTEPLPETSEVISEVAANPIDERALGTMPVKVEIFYDGVLQKPFAVESRGEKQLFIPEPQEGQKVTFRLTRVDNATDARYGVVLRVNGESTIDRETLPVRMCKRWVLGKGDRPVTIRGLIMTDRPDEVLPIKVLNLPDSLSREINYGDQAGQISYTIFREGARKALPDRRPRLGETDELALDLVTRGTVPLGAADKGSLRGALDLLGQDRRGIMEFQSDPEPGKPPRFVRPFQDPGQVDTVTIIYRPKQGD